jgi:hypothetical protein
MTTLPSEWTPIPGAPFDRDLELAVIDYDGPHALVFPCRRILNGWINAQTKARFEVRPTHWRPWDCAVACVTPTPSQSVSEPRQNRNMRA